MAGHATLLSGFMVTLLTMWLATEKVSGKVYCHRLIPFKLTSKRMTCKYVCITYGNNVRPRIQLKNERSGKKCQISPGNSGTCKRSSCVPSGSQLIWPGGPIRVSMTGNLPRPPPSPEKAAADDEEPFRRKRSVAGEYIFPVNIHLLVERPKRSSRPDRKRRVHRVRRAGFRSGSNLQQTYITDDRQQSDGGEGLQQSLLDKDSIAFGLGSSPTLGNGGEGESEKSGNFYWNRGGRGNGQQRLTGSSGSEYVNGFSSNTGGSRDSDFDSESNISSGSDSDSSSSSNSGSDFDSSSESDSDSDSETYSGLSVRRGTQARGATYRLILRSGGQHFGSNRFRPLRLLSREGRGGSGESGHGFFSRTLARRRARLLRLRLLRRYGGSSGRSINIVLGRPNGRIGGSNRLLTGARGRFRLIRLSSGNSRRNGQSRLPLEGKSDGRESSNGDSDSESSSGSLQGGQSRIGFRGQELTGDYSSGSRRIYGRPRGASFEDRELSRGGWNDGSQSRLGGRDSNSQFGRQMRSRAEQLSQNSPGIYSGGIFGGLQSMNEGRSSQQRVLGGSSGVARDVMSGFNVQLLQRPRIGRLDESSAGRSDDESGVGQGSQGEVRDSYEGQEDGDGGKRGSGGGFRGQENVLDSQSHVQ
ncbi:unnamed protein product [Ixodes pacificus]